LQVQHRANRLPLIDVTHRRLLGRRSRAVIVGCDIVVAARAKP
jgi:hypothetical protein